MIIFPCAKINLGLNVVSQREDGYHDIETVFYPIPLNDALEINYMDNDYPSEVQCDLKVTGNSIDCDETKNLVIRAYNLLAADYDLQRVHVHLYKYIPSQAGLGGGSSDGAYMIRLLDKYLRLNIGYTDMETYATRLGADCAFFIKAEPSYATGIGDTLTPVDVHSGYLHKYYIVIVKPDIAVSTKDAYKAIKPHHPTKCSKDVVCQPIETWKYDLTNDFETSVFDQYPKLKAIKEKMYSLGAVYAQMSGSGSAIYGIFNQKPHSIEKEYIDCFTFISRLK